MRPSTAAAPAGATNAWPAMLAAPSCSCWMRLPWPMARRTWLPATCPVRTKGDLCQADSAPAGQQRQHPQEQPRLPGWRLSRGRLGSSAAVPQPRRQQQPEAPGASRHTTLKHLPALAAARAAPHDADVKTEAEGGGPLADMSRGGAGAGEGLKGALGRVSAGAKEVAHGAREAARDAKEELKAELKASCGGQQAGCPLCCFAFACAARGVSLQRLMWLGSGTACRMRYRTWGRTSRGTRARFPPEPARLGTPTACLRLSSRPSGNAR